MLLTPACTISFTRRKARGGDATVPGVFVRYLRRRRYRLAVTLAGFGMIRLTLRSDSSSNRWAAHYTISVSWRRQPCQPGFLTSLREEHFDEAIVGRRRVSSITITLGADNITEAALGNLGSAY